LGILLEIEEASIFEFSGGREVKKSPPTFKKLPRVFLNKQQSHTVGGHKSSMVWLCYFK
jgi:hypothetical protein